MKLHDCCFYNSLIYITSIPNAYRAIITLPGMINQKENVNWGRNNNKLKNKQK